MKRTVRVTIEKEYDIELADEVLTEEHVKMFESAFWELDGNTFEEKRDDLFKVAAHQISRGEYEFVEGIGYCCPAVSVAYKRQYSDKNIVVVYEELTDYTDAEFVE